MAWIFRCWWWTVICIWSLLVGGGRQSWLRRWEECSNCGLLILGPPCSSVFRETPLEPCYGRQLSDECAASMPTPCPFPPIYAAGALCIWHIGRYKRDRTCTCGLRRDAGCSKWIFRVCRTPCSWGTAWARDRRDAVGWIIGSGSGLRSRRGTSCGSNKIIRRLIKIKCWKTTTHGKVL